jgi:hypothetical protein
MFNPESIDLTSLPLLPLEGKTAFPKQPTICFAIDGLGNIHYMERLSTQSRDGKRILL